MGSNCPSLLGLKGSVLHAQWVPIHILTDDWAWVRLASLWKAEPSHHCPPARSELSAKVAWSPFHSIRQWTNPEPKSLLQLTWLMQCPWLRMFKMGITRPLPLPNKILAKHQRMPDFGQCYCQDSIQEKLSLSAKVTKWSNLYWIGIVIYKSVQMWSASER